MTQQTLWNVTYTITGSMLIGPCLLMLANMFNPGTFPVNVMVVAIIIGWVIFPVTLCIIVFIGMLIHSLLKRSN